MITWIKLWVEQIIVAVVISIIVEMILPEGNKKYIKMVLGLYVLFSIVQPVISKTTNADGLLDFDYKKYFGKNIYSSSKLNEFDENNNELIEQTYIKKIKDDIISKVEKNGYKVENINISIVGNRNSQDYGKISNLELKLSKSKLKNEITNKIAVQNINIGNNQITNTLRDNFSIISESEKNKIIEFITKEYSLENKNIIKIN